MINPEGFDFTSSTRERLRKSFNSMALREVPHRRRPHLLIRAGLIIVGSKTTLDISALAVTDDKTLKDLMSKSAYKVGPYNLQEKIYFTNTQVRCRNIQPKALVAAMDFVNQCGIRYNKIQLDETSIELHIATKHKPRVVAPIPTDHVFEEVNPLRLALATLTVADMVTSGGRRPAHYTINDQGPER